MGLGIEVLLWVKYINLLLKERLFSKMLTLMEPFIFFKVVKHAEIKVDGLSIYNLYLLKC